MKSYIDMCIEAMLYYERELYAREKDHLWIIRKTGSYGWTDTVFFEDQCLPSELPGHARVCKTGNPIDYQRIATEEVGSYVGIFEVDPGRFAGQFLGSKRFRIHLTESEIELVLQKMCACKSMLTAIEEVLGVPLQEIQSRVLIERFPSN